MVNYKQSGSGPSVLWDPRQFTAKRKTPEKSIVELESWQWQTATSFLVWDGRAESLWFSISQLLLFWFTLKVKLCSFSIQFRASCFWASRAFSVGVTEERFELKGNLNTRILGLKSSNGSPFSLLQKWVDQGNKLSISELRHISSKLIKLRRYQHALEVWFPCFLVMGCFGQWQAFIMVQFVDFMTKNPFFSLRM